MKPVISTIKDIYPSSQAEAQKQRYKSAVTAFAEHFGSIGEHRFFSAPGRTEICGNHTDHNHGKVFAASVNLDVIAVVEPTEDDKIVIKSEGFPEDSVDLSQLAVVPEEKNTSASLIRGVAAGFEKEGMKIGGFRAYTTSDVMKGSLCGVRGSGRNYPFPPVQRRSGKRSEDRADLPVCRERLFWQALRSDGSDGVLRGRIHRHRLQGHFKPHHRERTR